MNPQDVATYPAPALGNLNAGMTPPVRRCGRCGGHALCARAWEHTYNGAAIGTSTDEYACTSCGATFVIRASGTAIAMWIVGGVLIATFLALPLMLGLGGAAVWMGVTGVVLGAPFALAGHLLGRPARKNPIDDRPLVGPLPARPIPREEMPRICAKCGGAARCATVTKAGRLRTLRWTFVCAGCSREIEVDSVGRTVVDASLGALILLVGLVMLPGVPEALKKGDFWHVALGLAAPVVGVGVLGAGAARVRNRVVNKRA